MGANVPGADVGPINASIVSGSGEAIKNPLINTGISQYDVGSTLRASKDLADSGDTKTVAFENKEKGMEKAAAFVDPELNSQLAKAIAYHSSTPKSSNENPSLTPKYGDISN
jgi:hypothetical protein